MAGPWEEYAAAEPVPTPAPAPEQRGPWDDFAPAQPQPRAAHGVGEAIQAGWEGSATGLAARGKLPDVVLDPHHAKWYEKLSAGATQMVAELPEMIAGGIGGAAAGTATAGPVGTIVGGGAGAFALPTAIREGLMQYYDSQGPNASSADFLMRSSIVLKHTAKDALVGALTGGAGAYVGKLAAPLAESAVAAGRIGETTAKIGVGTATTTAELGTMTVAPAALEGRLPEPEDFMNAAILVAGLKGAHVAASRIRKVYAETGRRPEEVVADAQRDPTIARDLAAPVAEAPPATPRSVLEQATVELRGKQSVDDWLKEANYTNGLPEAAAALGVEVTPGKSRVDVVNEIKAQIGEPPAEPSPYVDTRGGGERFHGTGKAISGLSDEYALSGDNRNIYGQGFYTTDAADISAGYMKKGGKESVLYKVEHPDVKLYDMEAPLTPEATAIVRGAMGEHFPTKDAETGKPLTNLREIYDEYRRESQNNGLTRDAVQDTLDAIRASLERQGYGGFRHVGGKNTGNKEHEVKIFWTPEASGVRITPADIEAYRTRPANEIPGAYQAEAQHQRNADIVPGVKTEQVRDEPFGPVTQAAGEPARPTEVNYNLMHTTDDAKGALARLSTVYEAEIQSQRRGTVSWEQTQAEAGQHIADMLGSTEPFQPRQPGTAAGAAELLARKQMLQGAAEDMATKARSYLDTPADQRTPQQTAEYLASIERAAMIQSEFLGARAEAGRALNILKETKVAAERAKQIDELLSRYGKDPETLAKMMAELDNPAAALKFAKEANKATTWEKIIEAWKAGLVSGPITQAANVMGNLSFAAMRPAVDAVAATFGLFTRAPDRVSFAEPLARVVGNLHGVMDGLKIARVAFMEDAPAGKAESYKQAIPGTAGYVIRTPFRALSAMDALFRNMAERGETYAIATRQAAKEGYNPATSEFRQRVVEISQNLTPEQMKAVADVGERLVFQAPLGKAGRATQNFVKAAHLEWAVPFISTPANVFKEMARLTPLAPAIGEWRAAVAKGGPEAQKAFAEMAIGTGISALATSWALSGNISGSGDPDPNARRAQMASGWQPYSIKINNTWYSYQRIQPLGTLLGMAADMASVWEHMTPEESDKLPKIIATAFANSVTNQTFLSGMTSVVQVLADPQRYGPKFIQGLAGSVVPAVIGQPAQLMDPYQREIGSMMDAIKNRIPGVRESMTPSRDIFGEPQANPERLGGISPITERTLSEDPVRQEAARLGVGQPEAPKSIEMPSGGDAKLGKVMLTQEQRDVFGSTSGKMAHDIMAQMVNSPGWHYMPDFVKQKAFKEVFEKTRQVGKYAALTAEQRQQEIQRITGEISKRLAQ